MATDLETLLDMGFEKLRAEMAVQKTGGRMYPLPLHHTLLILCIQTLTSCSVQGALEWLERNQDKSTDEISAAEAEAIAENDPNTEAAELKPGEEARSLKCNECQRKFRSHAQAEFHASKSGHVDFSESTEEVAPLTEEEKKAKLDEMRRRLAEKRAGGSEQDKLDQKRNEVSHSTSSSA